MGPNPARKDLSAGSLPAEFWTEPGEMPGVRLELGAAVEFLERTLTPYLREFELPLAGAPEFQLDNSRYASVDAEALYAIVRHFKPRRVIELGSGWSSLVIGAAIARNAGEGKPAEFQIFDPSPRAELQEAIRRHGDLNISRAEHIPMTTFERLAADDVIFVDTSHVVRVGGEVNHLLLNVLPGIAQGVLAHFHDIFLPYQYPRVWIEEQRRRYTEQYLLQAFLVYNDRFEVVFPAHALAREYPDRLGAAVASFRAGMTPSSFWIRRL